MERNVFESSEKIHGKLPNANLVGHSPYKDDTILNLHTGHLAGHSELASKNTGSGAIFLKETFGPNT